jgi:tetratricopeptide (TPR) repeat protein
LDIQPDSPDAQNNLARVLASLTPAQGGDPVRAVALAQRACELTDNQVPVFLDTLAAAYAATSRFDDAVTTAEKAVELARTAGQAPLAEQIQRRLEMYRGERRYRELLEQQNQSGATKPHEP